MNYYNELKRRIRKRILDKSLGFGTYKLHSCQISYYYFDILKIITDEEFVVDFMDYIFANDIEHLVGMEFGGALLAGLSGKPFSIIRKDNSIYGNIPKNYSLIDDVTTTENSLRNAITKIGIPPEKNITIVDRREPRNRMLRVQSILDVMEEVKK